MGYPPAGQGINQCPGCWFLPNYLGKGLRAPLAVKDLRGHIGLLLLYPIYAAVSKGFWGVGMNFLGIKGGDCQQKQMPASPQLVKLAKCRSWLGD